MEKVVSALSIQLKRTVVKYFIIAAFIAALEVVTFAVMNSLLNINYLVATTLSLTLSIILNWYLSKVYVFSTSRFRVHIEVILVAIASIIGLGIQLIVITICIKVFHVIPVVGKIIAICIAFIWNYLSRKKFIFNHVVALENKQ